MWFSREDQHIARRLLAAGALVIALSLSSATAEAGPREELQALFQQGGQYYAKGDYAKAAEIFQRAEKLGERTLGPTHPAVATILNNLANVYMEQGRYAEAEPLLKRALAIKQKDARPRPSRSCRAAQQSRQRLSRQGRNAEAEPLYKRVLASMRKALGPDHPDVGREPEQSRGTVRRARPIRARPSRSTSVRWRSREKALGPDHPDVATSLNNLAVLYIAQGQLRAGRAALQALAGDREKASGPDHPDVATSLNNLAELYSAKASYARPSRSTSARWRYGRRPWARIIPMWPQL